MASLVICEKPSQAKNVRAAVSNRYGKVLALRGHMLRLAEPEEVNPAWESWDYTLLRPESGFYPFRKDTSRGKGDVHKELEAALRECSRVIIATDPDREGQAIGENLLRFHKFRGEVMRVMFNAEDAQSISEAFGRMRPNQEHLPLYQSAVARAQLDQIANFTATRVVTLALKPSGMRGAMGVGRVKTPTMAIVCRRQIEIDQFKPRAYFDLWMDVAHAGDTVRLNHVPKEERRIYDQGEATAFVTPLADWSGPVAVERARKRQAPPKLPNLPVLQARAAGWGWTAKRTLDTAQSLYETYQVTTYPRADSRYLPEVEIDNAGVMLAELSRLPFAKVSYQQPTIRKGKGGHFSDAGLAGSAHHAIVPNVKTAPSWGAAIGKMNADEQKLFKLIATMYLAAIGPDREYDRTEFSVDVRGRRFVAVGIVEIKPGWREAVGKGQQEGDDDEEESSELPDWKDGAQGRASGAGVTSKMTKPPAFFTEGTLITAMTEAWRYTDDPVKVERLREAKGIGTTATRDGIIEGLKRQGYFAIEKGKVKATPLALGLYRELMQACPEWLDPAATAEMEMALDQIMQGTVEPRALIQESLKRTQRLIECMADRAQRGGPLDIQVKQPPSAKMLAAARAKAKREGVSLPRGAAGDASICREFLGPRPEGNGPTEGQLQFAQRIAAAMSVALDDELLGDRQKLSAWIDQHKGALSEQGGGDAPSAKQVAAAEAIAASKGIEVPAETLKSRSSLSKWISSNGAKKGRSGARRKAGAQQ